jgi:hypothetical protein
MADNRLAEHLSASGGNHGLEEDIPQTGDSYQSDKAISNVSMKKEIICQ